MDQQNLGQNVDLRGDETLTCQCGSIFFVQNYIVKKVSGLKLGAPVPYVPMGIPVWRCVECGEVNLELFPKNVLPDNEDDVKPQSTIITK